MRILIYGGRHFANQEKFDNVMDGYIDVCKVVIHGCATGADHMAYEWASKHKKLCLRFPIKGSGPERNRAIIESGRPDLVIAFPGG